jgi:hypothetical protein
MRIKEKINWIGRILADLLYEVKELRQDLKERKDYE